MKMEEYSETALINWVHEAVKKLLIDLNYPDDFRKPRLQTELTERIVQSYL